MNISDCIKFTNKIPVCYLATVENDQPRVRAIGFWPGSFLDHGE